MGKKVVTLGEIMLRLSTPGNTRFVQSDSFDVVYGGGEANVAVSCANYGHDAYFVTKLPKHEIGQSAVKRFAQIWCKDRLHRTWWRPRRYLLSGNRCIYASQQGDLRPCPFCNC